MCGEDDIERVYEGAWPCAFVWGVFALKFEMSTIWGFQKSARGSFPYGFGIFSEVKNT
jgi:hypothetical protein